MRKTHKVIDLVYHEDEGNVAHIGTEQECHDFVTEESEAGGSTFTYEVVPLLDGEIEAYNN